MSGNTQRIDDLVDLASVETQLKTTKGLLSDLEKQMVADLNAANQLRDALSKVSNNTQFKKVVAESDTATQRITANQSKILKVEQERQRLEEKRKRIVQESTQAELAAARANTTVTSTINAQNQALSEQASRATAASAANQRYGQQHVRTAADINTETAAVNANTTATTTNATASTAASATVGSGIRSIWSNIRQLAYILPGIGIAGIFGLIFSGIGAAVSAVADGGKAIDALKAKLDSLKGALESTDYTTAVTNVSLLSNEIKLASEGLIDQDKVVNHYNETIGKTTGQVKNLDEAEKALAKNAEAYIRFTLLKAAANLALQDAAKAAYQAEQDRLENEEKIRKFAQTPQYNNAASKAANEQLQIALGMRNKNIREEGEKEVKTYKDIAEKFFKEAAQISKDNKFDFFGGGFETKDPKKSNIYSQMLETLKESLSGVLQYEKTTFDERLLAIEAFEQASNKLIDKGVKTKEFTQQEGAKRSLDITNKSNKDRVKVESDAQKELLQLFKEGEKNQKEILQNSENTFKAASAARLLQVDQERQQMIEVIANQYEKGIISKAAYEQKKADIEYSYNIESVKNSIQLAEDLIRVKKEFGEDTTNDEIELAKLQIKLSEQVTNKKLTDLDKQMARQKEVNAAVKNLAEEAANFVIALVDAGFTNRKNALRAEQDQLEERTAQEIAAVDRSLGTEQEKADKIAVIRAKEQSEKDKIAKQQRAIDVEKAKFDKAVAIARIIENTAIGITSALAQFPPNVPLSILIGALGAVQLGTVLAQPIPAYAKGTKNAKGGLSIVGEQGRELIETPSGKSFLSAGTASLINLPAGSKVTPHHETMRMIGRPENLAGYKDREEVPWREVIAAIERNKPTKQGNKINVNVDAGFYIYRENHFR